MQDIQFITPMMSPAMSLVDSILGGYVRTRNLPTTILTQAMQGLGKSHTLIAQANSNPIQSMGHTFPVLMG